jgi:hypothetical protein
LIHPPVLDLGTPHLPAAVRFNNCPELASAVLALLRGWDAGLSEPGPQTPFLTITRKRARYHWDSDIALKSYTWARHAPRSVMSALCEIHYELSDWFVEDNPGFFCLHCAGVRIGGGVVIFPSDQRAGKSVLSMQFAQRGHELFGDDVVAIEPKSLNAYALGLLPRLRVPFPENLGGGFRAFVAARPGPENHQYRYVGLRGAEHAPLGRTAPITGFVLLERMESGPAVLEPVSQGETLARLIRKNFATNMPVTQIFERLKSLTGVAQRWRLRYSDGDSAIAALRERFGA